MTDAAERLDDVLAELAELGELDVEPELDPLRDHVTLVLVSHDAHDGLTHDGTRWYDEVIVGLATQTRMPDRVIAVDTSTDKAHAATTLRRLMRAVPDALTIAEPGGFCHALSTALTAAGPVTGAAAEGRIQWVWILHDDSAPAPDALERLLRYSALAPSATVLGPKCLDFEDPRIVVEVGITCDRAGRRETGLEHRELDQGQHDTPRDVLAVGSAGMLVRREVWDRLKGFDPQLDFARDDLDFGWRAWLSGERVCVVPSAKVRHARAVQRGIRVVDETNPHRRDRRNAAYVVLANASAVGFILGLPRLAIGVIARTLGHLLTRAPLSARSDVAALSLLANPTPVLAGRRRRRGQFTMSRSSIDPLLASRTLRLRSYLQAGIDWMSGGDPEEGVAEMGSGLGIDDDADGLSVLGSTDETTILRRLIRHPAIFLALGLILVSVIAGRDLLGRGPLAGGRLLPVPAGSSDLWSQLLTGWHDVGAGVATTASLWTAPMAVLSTIALGKPWVVVDLLLIFLPVLCATSVWRASRNLGMDDRLRAWAAATYAVGPVTISVINGGRFDIAWAMIAAPLLARGMLEILTAYESRRRWHCTWALALWLALAAAFWPPIWVVASAGLVLGALALRLRGTSVGRGTHARMLVIIATPAILAFTSAPHVLRHPQVLWAGWGVAGDVAGIPADRAPRALDTLLLHGSAAVGAIWLTVPILLAAIAGFVRRSTRTVALGCLAAAVGLIGAGVLVSRISLGGVGAQVGAPDGYFALATVALLISGTLGARGINEALSGRAFSWRQPAVVVLTVMASVLPIVSAFSWMVNSNPGPLHRRDTAILPPFVAAETQRTPGSRVLFLDRASGRAPVEWSITPLSGPAMGDEDVDDPMRGKLAAVIADLSSRRGTDAGELLSTFGISYIAAPTNADSSLIEALDEAPALFRVAYVGPLRLWRPTFVSGRVLVLPPAAGQQALAAPDAAFWSQHGSGRGPTQLPRSVGSPQTLSIGVNGGSAQVPVGIANRVVVLAVPYGTGWKLTYNGHRLPETKAWGWASSYTIPTEAGVLKVTHSDVLARGGFLITLALLVIALVLAAPDIRRRTVDEGAEG